MQTVLVYGDSNVWGDNFNTGVRIPRDKQWVNVLRTFLKDKYLFLQEGLPGRCAGDLEVEKPYKNGLSHFMAIFRTCAPVDIVIIALGTNDLQIKYEQTAQDIINSLLEYEKKINALYEDLDDRKKFFVNEKMPRIIYIMPPNFDYMGSASVILDEKSEEKRREIIAYFEKEGKDIIVAHNISLFEDGIHLNFEGHRKMASLVMEALTNE